MKWINRIEKKLDELPFRTLKEKQYVLDDLLKAKDLLGEGYKIAVDSDYEEALVKFRDAKKLFEKIKDETDIIVVLHWIAFSESNRGNLAESAKIFAELEKTPPCAPTFG